MVDSGPLKFGLAITDRDAMTHRFQRGALSRQADDQNQAREARAALGRAVAEHYNIPVTSVDIDEVSVEYDPVRSSTFYTAYAQPYEWTHTIPSWNNATTSTSYLTNSATPIQFATTSSSTTWTSYESTRFDWTGQINDNQWTTQPYRVRARGRMNGSIQFAQDQYYVNRDFSFHRTPEDLELLARQREDARQRQIEVDRRWKEAAAARALAESVAEQLILGVLDVANRNLYIAKKQIIVHGSRGNRYCIRHGRAHNVDRLDDHGCKIEDLCAHVQPDIPNADNMVAQMFALQCDEDHFRSTANITAVRPQCAKQSARSQQGLFIPVAA